MKTTSKAQVRMQKATAAICAAAMVASMLPCAASAEPSEATAATQEETAQLAATDVIASGTSGTCTWVVDSEGTLTVSPTTGSSGELGTWTSQYGVPWDYCNSLIASVKFVGDVKAQTCCYMFYCCSSLTSLDLSGLDTSNATDMSGMFYCCSSLASLDLSGLDTSNATDMNNMLAYCSSLTSLDLSGLDTSNATNMFRLFYGCKSLSSLYPPSDTSQATNLSDMFVNCSSLGAAERASLMRGLLSSNGGKCTNWCTGLFAGCPDESIAFSDLGLDTSEVTDMDYMFGNCPSLVSVNLSGLDTSNASVMNYMFHNCPSLTSVDLSGLDTSSVERMCYMFKGCASLVSLDLTALDTSSVTNMRNMFSDCSSLETIKVGAGWITAEVAISNEMFSGCTSLVGGKGTAFDSTQTDATYARVDFGPDSDAPGYLTGNAALTLKASCAPADKGEKATVTTTLTGADSATYRFYYSADGGATWKQAAKNATGTVQVTATPTNSARPWKVVATTADGQTAEASFEVAINDLVATTSTTPAAKYNAKATVNVSVSHYGTYGPAKYKYYYSADNGATWKQVAYHNKQYTDTDSLQVTANGTNAKRLWKVVVTFKDGRTAEAPFTVSYA